MSTVQILNQSVLPIPRVLESATLQMELVPNVLRMLSVMISFTAMERKLAIRPLVLVNPEQKSIAAIRMFVRF
jgi:hypothetical protein